MMASRPEGERLGRLHGAPWHACLQFEAQFDASWRSRTIYTFTFFTTDQYAANLPEMQMDLSGSQSLMSAAGTCLEPRNETLEAYIGLGSKELP